MLRMSITRQNVVVDPSKIPASLLPERETQTDTSKETAGGTTEETKSA